LKSLKHAAKLAAASSFAPQGYLRNVSRATRKNAEAIGSLSKSGQGWEWEIKKGLHKRILASLLSSASQTKGAFVIC